MSRLPIPKGLVETRTQTLKMQCPGCAIEFYWMAHHPYCSDECSEVERAANALKLDNDEWHTPPWVAAFASTILGAK